MSTWLEPGSAYEKEVLQNKGAPIFWGHGVADPMVPAVLGTNSVLHLRKLGYTVDHKEYPGMGHSACPAELEDIRALLSKILPATPPKPLTAEEIDAMPVKELRRKLQAANVTVSDTRPRRGSRELTKRTQDDGLPREVGVHRRGQAASHQALSDGKARHQRHRRSVAL